MHRAFLIGLAALLTTLFPVAAFADTGRAAFTCPSQTSCPGTGYVTFNSFTNAPSYGGGNEVAFFRIKNANDSQPGFTNGKIDIKDDAVLMQVYIHNDANPLNSTDSTAHNTVLSIALPNGYAAQQTATATVASSNSNPSTVSDSVSMMDSQAFGLVFDPNASVNLTKRANNGQGDFVTTGLPDNHISNNVMTIDFGDWPGGFSQHGLVTVRVLVQRPPAQPAVLSANTQAFACTSLDVATVGGNTATFTAHSNNQAAGATVSSYNFVVKDSKGGVVDNSTIYTSNANGVYSFNQKTAGTYTVYAVINSDKGSTNSNTCNRQITVPAQVAAATTKTIPNTGAGDVLGLFAGASTLGSVGHFAIMRYRRR